MAEKEKETSVPRARTACVECRQQKAKCDAFQDPGQPCTRCRKMGVRCYVSSPFKRQHKRQKLEELQHEADELRRKLRDQSSSTGTVEHRSPMAMLTAAAMSDVPPALSAPRKESPPLSVTAQPWPVSSPSRRYATPYASDVPTTMPPAEPTIARVIDGYRVEADSIDEIFHSFFNDYARFLPILDLSEAPNVMYARCKFLFWAVMGVACRTYSKNPTMFNALSERVLDSALSSLPLKGSSIPVVQGLLLILTWPMIERHVTDESTFPLAGALVHMAMGIGLHIPMSSQDFNTRVKLRLTGAEVDRRRELWGHCIIAYQRICTTKGQYGLTIPDVATVISQFPAIGSAHTMNLGFQLRANGLITKLHTALIATGIQTAAGPDQERAIDNLINIFDAQLNEMGYGAAMYIDDIALKATRLHIASLHFHKQLTLTHLPELNDLCNRALALITAIHHANDTTGFLSVAPKHFAYHTLIAACTLLRLLKSPFAQYLDKSAEATFFQAINFEKRLSRHANDIGAKSGTILSVLWNSRTALRSTDGMGLAPLRVRSRLSSSVVFDCVLWYREESRSQTLGSGGGVVVEDPARPKLPEADKMIGNPQTQWPQELFRFSDDPFLSEFGWALDQDLLSMGLSGW